MCFDKLIKKEPEKNKGLEVLLKVFLVIGIAAGVCVILKFLYDKFFRDNYCYCDDEYDDDDYCSDDECDCCDCDGDISGNADTADTQDNE